MYKNKTPYFQLPYVGKGERIIAEAEQLKYQIIENQLIGGTKGIKCAVFEDGEYNLEEISPEEYSVVLAATGSTVSISGLVNGAYFQGKSRVQWTNLEPGAFYYLYIKWTNKMLSEKTAFRTFSSKTRKEMEGKGLLLVATVDLRDDAREIDIYPDGKVYATDIASHSNDKTNPHGRHIYQDELTILKQLIFTTADKYSKDPVILIDDIRDNIPAIKSTRELILGDKRIDVPLSEDDNEFLTTENKSLIGSINEINDKFTTIDFNTGGSTGTLLEVNNEKTIAFAQVQQLSAGPEVGSVSFAYNENTVTVSNSGETGIPMRALIMHK